MSNEELITPFFITDDHTYFYISFLNSDKCNYDNIKQINGNIEYHFYCISRKNYTKEQFIDMMANTFSTPISFPIILNMNCTTCHEESRTILKQLTPIFGTITYDLSPEHPFICADEEGCF